MHNFKILSYKFGIINTQINIDFLKKIFVKFYILGFVLAAIFPGKIDVFSNEVSLSQAKAHESVIVNIQLVALPKATEIEIQAGRVVPALGCKPGFLSSQNLVQNTSSVNLNQPANCFALTDAVVAKTENIHLSVISLPRDLRPIVIVGSKTAIVSETYSRGQAENKIPSVPELSFSALTVFAFIVYRKIKESKISFEVKSFNIFSLNRFEVLRC